MQPHRSVPRMVRNRYASAVRFFVDGNVSVRLKRRKPWLSTISNIH